jgi:flagellar basal-body rod modification protein FlgD
MATESIGGVANSAQVLADRAGIGQEEFLKVLLAQLTFQDPLKPLDNNEFIAQFAQLTNLQQTQQLNEKLDSLLTFQAGAQAVGLIGRTVQVQTESSFAVGRVTTINFTNAGVPQMTVLLTDGSSLVDVTLGQIQTVRN